MQIHKVYIFTDRPLNQIWELIRNIFLFSAYERICQISLYTLIHQIQLIWFLDGNMFSLITLWQICNAQNKNVFENQAFGTMIIFNSIRTLSTNSLLLALCVILWWLANRHMKHCVNFFFFFFFLRESFNLWHPFLIIALYH